MFFDGYVCSMERGKTHHKPASILPEIDREFGDWFHLCGPMKDLGKPRWQVVVFDYESSSVLKNPLANVYTTMEKHHF
jgi:hypothetical protein